MSPKTSETVALVSLIRSLIVPVETSAFNKWSNMKVDHPSGASGLQLSWDDTWDVAGTTLDVPGKTQDGGYHHQVLRSDVPGSRRVCDLVVWATRKILPGRHSVPDLFVLLFELKEDTNSGGIKAQLENSVSLAQLPLRRLVLRGEWSQPTRVRFLLASVKGTNLKAQGALPQPGLTDRLSLPYLTLPSVPVQLEQLVVAVNEAPDCRWREPWRWPWTQLG